MDKNSSNLLIKTVTFILVVLLSCLIFFGLGKEDKTDLELYAFGFIMFAELVTYLSLLIGSIKNFKKLDNSDVISWGVLYLITNIITNCLFFNKIDTIKNLIVINSIEIIIFLIIFCIIMMKKTQK